MSKYEEGVCNLYMYDINVRISHTEFTKVLLTVWIVFKFESSISGTVISFKIDENHIA